MDTKKLPATMSDKRKDVQYISDTFGLKSTVEQLHHMMKEVTATSITPQSVNAACNCVQQLNNTIDMAIKAARYLSEK